MASVAGMFSKDVNECISIQVAPQRIKLQQMEKYVRDGLDTI